MPLEVTEKLAGNDGSWILFGIFCVSVTDRSSGNLDLVFRRDNRLSIKI